MPRTKKNRIDSASESQKVAAAALKKAKPLMPPKHVPLDECDMPFWHSVIAEFMRDEWTNHQLEMAANLARMLADLTREQQELRNEGVIAYSEKGTPVINPRKTAVQMYAGTILAMRRSLSLHARAQSGEPRDVGKRRDKGRALADAVQDAADENLIARPDHAR